MSTTSRTPTSPGWSAPAIARISPTSISSAIKTVGVAFGVAYNKTPYQAQTREPWGYPEVAGGLVIGGDKDGVQSSFYERKAYLGVLEFEPNDQLHMLVDAYHSDFKELQTVQRIEFGTIWAGATLTNPGPVVNGRVQSGTFANVPFVVIENYNNDRRADIDSLGWNTEYQLNDNWNLVGDVSWSRVKREDLRLESTAGTGTNNDPDFLPQVDSISFTTDGNGISHFTPTLDYSDYNTVFLTDPGGWGGGQRRSGFVGNPEIEDEIKAIRLSAERKLGTAFMDGVTFGANFAERVKSKDNFQSILYLPGDISHAVVPEEFRTGITNTSFFGSPHGMIGYNAIGLYRSGFWQPVDSFLDPNPAVGNGDRQSAVTNDWEVTEKLTTAFVKVGIDTAGRRIAVTRQHRRAERYGGPVFGHQLFLAPESRRGDRAERFDRHLGRQVHRCAAEPEPGARAAERHEIALRRGHHRGAAADG